MKRVLAAVVGAAGIGLAFNDVAAGASVSPYRVDESRLYASAAFEGSERPALLDEVGRFVEAPGPSVTTAGELLAWLTRYEDINRRLFRHENYVYLRAERDRNDKLDAAADDVLVAAMERVDAAARRVLGQIGAPRLSEWAASDAELARYGYFLKSSAALAEHAASNVEAIDVLVRPVLASLMSSYTALRARAMDTNRVALPDAGAGSKAAGPRQTFESAWRPYLANEDAFAALLVPIVSVQTGKARLQGYASAPEAAYSKATLSAAQVGRALQALKASNAGGRYIEVVAEAAARHMHVGESDVHMWNLESADTGLPAAEEFPSALRKILASEQAMGGEYARSYAQLLDPSNGRVEWCREPGCDDVGFSMGYSGVTSGLFYGDFHGTTNQMRAVAHEAGHAVHRQFMNDHQPLAVYNVGPKFMFESFAIFNELLFLDHLSRSEPTAVRGYYLHQFLEDATHQLFGSAQEVELEESIYAGVKSGEIRSAADLDALTLQVLAHYKANSAVPVTAELRLSWARNRLYFTDPLYDVNYLFAGLLALNYLDAFERHPRAFAARYVALLKNGFTDTPSALLRQFLGVDLDDPESLARVACTVVEARTTQLKLLYEPQR